VMRKAPGVMQNRTPKACSSRNVSGTCQARATQYQAYVRACRCHTDLSCNVPPFLTLQSAKKDPSVHSENTPSHADTPRSYSLSPLKASRVTEVSWLVLLGRVLLLGKVIIKIMNNPTNKLAAFCTTGRLSQEVGQIIIFLMCVISDSPIATDSQIAW
jgi:hypothetical protein